MFEVTYERSGVQHVDTPGMTLLDISKQNAVSHYHACGGHARCSTCRVLIVAGADNLAPRTDAERALVERKGLPNEVRLACQTKVMGPVTVKRLVLDDHDAEAAYTNEASDQTGRSAGKAMEVAVLFSDIRGFTRFSERSYPYDVMHILNRYLFGVGEAIHRHDGYIDKYMGDGVMALFGMCGCGPEVAANQAVSAAIEMMDDLEQFNHYMGEQFGEQFRIGIGVHVGEVVVGEVGHPQRRQLTALGDVVNTASRIESATKEFSASLLVSDSVHPHIRDAVTIGRTVTATMKGKAEPQTLFEVLPDQRPNARRPKSTNVARTVLQHITRMDAPGLLRLAFHDALASANSGAILHPDNLALPENRGLEGTVSKLNALKAMLPEVSLGDLIVVAGAAAVERCGGPHIPVQLGRPDTPQDFMVSELPDRDEPVGTLRERFLRKGLSVRDLTALSGAHTLGKADGSPFTADPFSFSNSYFKRVLSGHNHLLASDVALLEDPESRRYVEEYAADERAFFADFVSAYRSMVAATRP
ncbi:MAG: peroxidase family protein [Myxococcota bacterium]